jgi:hypothetical protein
MQSLMDGDKDLLLNRHTIATMEKLRRSKDTWENCVHA